MAPIEYRGEQHRQIEEFIDLAESKTIQKSNSNIIAKSLKPLTSKFKANTEDLKENYSEINNILKEKALNANEVELSTPDSTQEKTDSQPDKKDKDIKQIAKSPKSKTIKTNNKKSKVTKNNKQQEKDYKIIAIAPGDTLTKLARVHNISLHNIAKENNLQKPYKLLIGQKIKIPLHQNTVLLNKTKLSLVEDFSYKTMIIKRGDALSLISSNYRVLMSDIIKINRLKKPYRINAGDKITIPVYPKYRNNSYTKISDISRDYHKKDRSLMFINEIYPNARLVKGQTIKLPLSDKQLDTIKKNYQKNINIVVANDDTQDFIWPTVGKIIAKYGEKVNGVVNDGIYIAATFDSDVFAVRDGTVVYVGNELKGYGNLVIIKHTNNWFTSYANLNKIIVTKGQLVSQRNVIGTVGKPLNYDIPQLHFSIRNKNKSVNPLLFLDKKKKK